MGNKINLLGLTFGKLIVIKDAGNITQSSGRKRVLWKCHCSCGNYTYVLSDRLRSGKTQSCGCITNKIDLVGQKFGRLTVLKENGRSKDGGVLWECQCDCGKKSVVCGHNLRRGTTVSCGCFQKEHAMIMKTTHGWSKQYTYQSYKHMLDRCTNKNSQVYHNYGGRGITVCDRWLNSYENFLEDMGERPEGMTIERKNNNLGYFKKNCCWITNAKQQRNKRNSRLVAYNGEIKCVGEWAEYLGISYDKLYYRVIRYPIEIAFMIGNKNEN